MVDHVLFNAHNCGSIGGRDLFRYQRIPSDSIDAKTHGENVSVARTDLLLIIILLTAIISFHWWHQEWSHEYHRSLCASIYPINTDDHYGRTLSVITDEVPWWRSNLGANGRQIEVWMRKRLVEIAVLRSKLLFSRHERCMYYAQNPCIFHSSVSFQNRIYIKWNSSFSVCRTHGIYRSICNSSLLRHSLCAFYIDVNGDFWSSSFQR